MTIDLNEGPILVHTGFYQTMYDAEVSWCSAALRTIFGQPAVIHPFHPLPPVLQRCK